MLARATDANLASRVTLRVLEQEDAQAGPRHDSLVEVEWRGRTELFACEIKTSGTPRSIEEAIAQASLAGRARGIRPMILVPYLSEEKLRTLADQEVSGLDACGNAYIQADQFLIWRSRQPNRFRTPSPHLNPFRGDNSIFTRCFLLRTEFASLSELRAFAEEGMHRPGNQKDREVMLLGTASKTVQALQEQLVIQKSQAMLRVLDNRKLLSQLKQNYQPPPGRRVMGKTSLDLPIAWERLGSAAAQAGFRLAATGTFSASHYGVLSSSKTLSIYVDDLQAATRALDFTEGKAFANCEVIETRKNFPYFNLKQEGGVPWASAIQTWLELASGTSREQEAAQELERMILGGVRDR